MATFELLQTERQEWSNRVFTGASPITCIAHLKEEIQEIEYNQMTGVRDPMEYVDAINLLVDAAYRDGITLSDLIFAMKVKNCINFAREFVINSKGYYSHK